MKVTFVTTSNEVWGAEQSMIGLSRGMLQSGKDVSLIAPPNVSAEWSAATGRTAARFPWRGRSRYARLAGALLLLIRTRNSAIVAFNLDALLVLGILRGWLHLRKNVLALDLHDVLDSPRGRRRLDLLSRKVDGVIGVSSFALLQLDKRVPTRRVERPIDSGSTPTRTPSVGPPWTVAIVGRIDPQKHVDFGIRAMFGAPNQLRLLIKGSASNSGIDGYLEECIALGRQLGPRFEYCGSVPHSDVLDGIDLLLVLNPTEPSGRTVAEAQIAGVPTIVPNAGGAAEFVTEGLSGFKFDSLDLESLQRVLTRISQLSVAEYQEISNTTRAEASARYELGNQASAYHRALNEFSSSAR